MKKRESSTTELTISKLAALCRVKTDTIRFYERIKLISPKRRAANGYRIYTKEAVREIKFIKNSQQVGFTLEEIAKLLRLKGSDRKTAEEVLQLTEKKIIELSANIEQLNKVKRVLNNLAKQCGGKHVLASECPILDHLYPNKSEEGHK
jgi:DNA-binding transcriptional MerR regulator